MYWVLLIAVIAVVLPSWSRPTGAVGGVAQAPKADVHVKFRPSEVNGDVVGFGYETIGEHAPVHVIFEVTFVSIKQAYRPVRSEAVVRTGDRATCKFDLADPGNRARFGGERPYYAIVKLYERNEDDADTHDYRFVDERLVDFRKPLDESGK
jgi:hypothetical protein